MLIGANGSGKSNLFLFLEMVRWMLGPHRLAYFVGMRAGADDQLFGGSRVTSGLKATLSLTTPQERCQYAFALDRMDDDLFTFSDERYRSVPNGAADGTPWQELGSGHREARIVNAATQAGMPGVDRAAARAIVEGLGSCTAYHFNDTSRVSDFTKRWDADDHDRLQSNGGNLAAVLNDLKKHDRRHYDRICRQIARIVPGFDIQSVAAWLGLSDAAGRELQVVRSKHSTPEDIDDGHATKQQRDDPAGE